MEQSRNTGKEQLAEELRKRLRWYQEEASDGEVDADEIDAILNLLAQLEPETQKEGKTEEEAYRLFEEKYLPEFQKRMGTDAEKDGNAGRKRHIMGKKAVRFAAIAAAVAVLLFTALNIGTYAATKKGFFEFIWQNSSGKSFFVTGETTEDMDSQEGMGFDVNSIQEYGSWDELPEDVQTHIMMPTYIPKDMTLETIRYWGGKYAVSIRAFYADTDKEKKMMIWIEHYDESNTWQQGIQEDMGELEEKVIGEKKCYVQRDEEDLSVYFFNGSELYTIFGNCSLENIEQVVQNMQYMEGK